MRRRDFLYNTGLLFPVLLSPSLALASEKIIDTEMLIIENKASIPDHVAAAINKLPVKVQQISGKHVSSLTHSDKGFLITLHDNTTYRTQKIVVHSSHRLHAPKSSVEIKTGEKSFHLNISGNDKNAVPPEFWFVKAKQIDTSNLHPFINRNRHAVMCLS